MPATINEEPLPATNGIKHYATFPVNGHYDSDEVVKDSRPAISFATGSSSSTSSSEAGSVRNRKVPSLDGINPCELPPLQTSHQIPSMGVHEGEAGGPQSASRARIRTWSDDPKTAQFPRISKPVELLRNSYDCIVIGSGYGGGVAASRMARAGESVCVLERGKERWPGEYPVETGESLEQLHFSGEINPAYLPQKTVKGGDPTGMYHLIFGNGQNALVANALGGTSLINANVFLEADADTLRLEAWPDEIRENPDGLQKYYKKAEDMLDPQEYPEDWPQLPKLDLLKKQAENLNMKDKFRRVRQTTRFRNGPNSVGVEMGPSALTGQDCTGLNDGSKNSILVTYLADAWNWGAEMFCETEVRYVVKAPDREGYLVYFAWHGRNRGHFPANLHGDLMWVHAKKAVFFGAGSIGTTEILLRSNQMGLELSERIGQNMSGNGDILAFGYNTDHHVNAIGKPFPSPYDPIGPTITGIIDNREGHENPEDGYVIEEGAIPKALAPFLQAMFEFLPGSKAPEDEPLLERVSGRLARLGSAILGPYFKKGAIERSQVFLVMSHDCNQAVLHLKDDKPVLEFVGVGRSDHVKELHHILEMATKSVGGTFIPNPFFSLLGQQQITVHPIGGACMARDGTGATGATNHYGELFTGWEKETHPGLIVMDAAVIPTALGANPFATITALAERTIEHYAIKQGLTIATDSNGIINLFGSPQRARRSRKHSMEECHQEKEEDLSISNIRSLISLARRNADGGFGFTEVMSGYVHHDHNLVRDNQETYELAARTAKSLCETARFFLSVQTFDTSSIVHDPEHKAMLTGTFACPTIPGSPFMVQRGNFNLFLLDHKAPGTRNLTYDFDMTGIDGRKLHFHGYKVVDSSVALAPVQFWKSTSTLYVTILETFTGSDHEPEGDEEGLRGKVVAKGIMRIQPQDLMSEVLTLTPTGSGLLKKAISATKFFTFFTRKSMSLFLAPLTPLQYPSPTYAGYINDTVPTHSYKIRASDGIMTSLHKWEPTNKAIETINLFMVPGAAVDHQIFALPTIRYNAVNYFRRAGYRVFVPVHRIGAIMPAQGNWTTFDARLDLKASLETIREEYGEAPVYCIAHCMGSVAMSAGLLDGTIPASWIKGYTASQVFMNPIWNTMNMIKILAAPIPLDLTYRTIFGTWFSCSTGHEDSYLQKLLNEAMRFMPDDRKEICNNASCHRVSFVFGRCWNHRNLNEATHRQIDRFFGGVNMTLLHLLMKQGFEGKTLANAPLYERLDTPENIRKLRGIPMMLFVGRDNQVLSPESTQKTYETLTDTFGTRFDDGVQYRRRVVPDYGHLDCWMGRNAWKDVYPFVREEVDRVTRGADYKFEHPHDRFWRMVSSGALNY